MKFIREAFTIFILFRKKEKKIVFKCIVLSHTHAQRQVLSHIIAFLDRIMQLK